MISEIIKSISRCLLCVGRRSHPQVTPRHTWRRTSDKVNTHSGQRRRATRGTDGGAAEQTPSTPRLAQRSLAGLDRAEAVPMPSAATCASRRRAGKVIAAEGEEKCVRDAVWAACNSRRDFFLSNSCVSPPKCFLVNNHDALLFIILVAEIL